MPTNVEVDRSLEQIAIVTLHRPESLHALNQPILIELSEAVQSIHESRDVSCTIITSSGDRAFCAGADLVERRTMSNEEVMQAVKLIGDTFLQIENLPMPVIAALNGVAFGGGLELALACDFRIAANHIEIGLTETSLAIIPGGGGTQRLPRLIGIGKAKQLIFMAKRISAFEAEKLGIVEEIVQKENLLDRAIEIALEIVQNGPLALRLAKSAINDGIQVDLLSGLEMELRYYEQTLTSEDRIEGLQAFEQKRKPIYKGK